MSTHRSDSSCNDCTPTGETKDFKKVAALANAPPHSGAFGGFLHGTGPAGTVEQPHKRVSVSLQLFEEVSRENSQLQSQLQDTQRVVSQTRLELEKATQVITQSPECPPEEFTSFSLSPLPPRPFFFFFLNSQDIYRNSLIQLLSSGFSPCPSLRPPEKIAKLRGRCPPQH